VGYDSAPKVARIGRLGVHRDPRNGEASLRGPRGCMLAENNIKSPLNILMIGNRDTWRPSRSAGMRDESTDPLRIGVWFI
jgi:hypothetical protein